HVVDRGLSRLTPVKERDALGDRDRAASSVAGSQTGANRVGSIGGPMADGRGVAVLPLQLDVRRPGDDRAPRTSRPASESRLPDELPRRADRPEVLAADPPRPGGRGRARPYPR